MQKKSIIYIIFISLLFHALPLHSQEGMARTIDSAMAISPYYMPVSYTHINPISFNFLTYMPVDTAIDRVHYYSPLNYVENIYQSLGMLTQAHQNMAYSFQRGLDFSYITLPYPLYFKQQSDLAFYDLKSSFSKIAYSFSFPKNTHGIDATYAQNVKDAIIMVNLSGYNNPGHFVQQGVAYFSMDATVHYQIPSKIYGFKVSYIFNRINAKENGGLADFKDTLDSHDYNYFLNDPPKKKLDSYTVNSSHDVSKIMSHDLLLQQYVKLKFKGKSRPIDLGNITHSFQYKHLGSTYFHPYIEEDLINSTIYPTDTIVDSLKYNSIINTLQWSTFTPFQKLDTSKYFFHLAGGIMHEYIDDKQNRYRDHLLSLFARTYIRLFSIMDIQGGISYSLIGYKSHDAAANAGISWAINRKKVHYLGFEASYYRISPDYIFSHYSGSSLQWDTTWQKQNILNLGFFWTRDRIKASVSYYMLHRYLIFGEDQMPFQIANSASVLQANIYTPFKIKNFGFSTNLWLQYSSNEYLPLPLFAGKASAYYIFRVFKRKLQIQVGLDMMYNTPYTANSYSTMLHQFYYQNKIKTGNFFYLDANVGLKIERISLFFRATNLLAGLIGNNYFTTPYYPMEERVFTVGINWRFYD